MVCFSQGSTPFPTLTLEKRGNRIKQVPVQRSVHIFLLFLFSSQGCKFALHLSRTEHQGWKVFSDLALWFCMPPITHIVVPMEKESSELYRLETCKEAFILR